MADLSFHSPWLLLLLLLVVGVGVALTILPIVTIAGFVVLAIAPTLVVLATFQIFRRASNFAVSKPARESLFTVASREDKYKAKNLMDTFIHRAGDAAVASLQAVAALALPVVTAIALPVVAVWLSTGLVLGRAQSRRAAAMDADAPA